MTLTIEQIEEQITNLQKTLEELKNPKMEITRNFTGQYFAPYEGIQYRRMESENIPIWECYIDVKKEWVILGKKEIEKLEQTYIKDCTSTSQETEK